MRREHLRQSRADPLPHECQPAALTPCGVHRELIVTQLHPGQQGSGVLSAESFDPDPYLAILARDGIHHATVEIEPGHAVA